MSAAAVENLPGRSPALPVATAVLINMVMGVVYVWSLFLLPLEAFLQISRAELSIVPSIALASFTVGMVLHDALLRQLGRSKFSILAFALAGLGHLSFAIWPGYWSLLLGYGLAFGLGAGLGYGLALALVSTTPDRSRAMAIGAVMAAFAFSGVALPFLLGPLIRIISPPVGFGVIGGAILAVGACVLLLLLRFGKVEAKQPKGGPLTAGADGFFGSDFLILATTFFFICFVGLMVVSQSTGVLASNGLSARVVELSPALFTIGYLVGSLFGGRLVEVLTGWRTLTFASIIGGLGLWLLDTPVAALALAGAAAVGATFGSSASFMPTLIGERYGAARIGQIYSKMMISYGLAGLLAPWISGLLFSHFGSYRVPILVGVAMCALSALLGLALRRKS